MRGLAEFIIRLVAYALFLGLASRVAEWFWLARGLDGATDLQALHDAGMQALAVAPVVLALGGIGFVRPIAVFVAGFLAAAAVTAPFAFARFAGA
jgi:hypothetical protein